MLAIIEQIYPWADTWLLEELYGGIQGRQAVELHDRMMTDIQAALDANILCAGAKIDLKKCFDTVCPDQAIDVWGALGGLIGASVGSCVTSTAGTDGGSRVGRRSTPLR